MVWLLNIFRCLCIVTTGAMVGYWIIKFHNNEDTTVIEYRSPKNKMTIYPELTICIRNPFLNVKLKEIDQRLNQETYLQYLKGHHMFNESYGTIDYDHVTVDLFDHLQKLEIYWKDNSNSTCLDKKDCASAIFRNNYNGFASAMFVKCFSLGHISKDDKVPRVIMLTFNATLKNILKNSGYVESLFTYPNQFTRADVKSQYIWYNPEETNIMETFEILSIETVKLRNKWNNPCFVDWMNYDDLLQQKHLKGVGCRPPYLNNLRDFPICNTSQQMKKAKFDFLQLPEDYHLVPCQGIPDVPYKYEQPFPNKTDGFTIVIIYPKNVKTIKQEQLVDLHSLIGNIGGYIGLFLGCAIVQLPEMVTSFWGFIKSRSFHISRKKDMIQHKEEVKDQDTLRNWTSRVLLVDNTNSRGIESDFDYQAKNYPYVMEKIEKLESRLEFVIRKVDQIENKF